MQLIDEKNDFPLRLLHFFDGRLQPFLELAAEAGAGDHGTQIQTHQALARKDFGDVVRDDLLGQAFDDGRLAHARIADEHRIVLGSPAEHLNDAQNLRIATNYRVELALARHRSQVTGIALQRAIAAFRARAAGLLATAALFHRLKDHLARDVRVAQQGSGEAVAFAHDAQHQVLCGHILVF